MKVGILPPRTPASQAVLENVPYFFNPSLSYEDAHRGGNLEKTGIIVIKYFIIISYSNIVIYRNFSIFAKRFQELSLLSFTFFKWVKIPSID